MSFRERYQDHTRDDRYRLCGWLQHLGIQAQMSERGRPEEKILPSQQGSLGVIDILEGPIRWVNVVSRYDRDDDQYYSLVYGVPDLKVLSGFPVVRIKAISRSGATRVSWETVEPRVKNFLDKLAGREPWKGKDFGLRIAEHLSQKVLATRAFLRCLSYQKNDFEIRAYPDRCCWILTVKDALAPSSREEWDS